MAVLSPFDGQNNIDYLDGKTDEVLGGPVLLSSPPPAGDGGGVAAADPTQAGPAVSTPSATIESGIAQSAPPTPAGSAFQPGQSLRENVISPVSSGIQEGQAGLQQAQQQFYDLAGPERTFEGIGGAGILGEALDTGELGEARGLVDAQYQGLPTLDYQGPGQRDLGAQAGALTSGSGLQSLVQTGRPQLTSGMAGFEAEQLLGTPGFRGEGESYQLQIDKLFGDLAKEQTRATEFAGTRAEQERGIAQGSRDYLGDISEQIRGDIDTRVGEATGQDEAMRRLWEQMMGGEGGLQDLAAFQTPGQTGLREAETQRQEVLDRFSDLSGIEPGELNVTGSGWEGHQVSIEGKDYRVENLQAGVTGVEGMSREESMALGARLLERERALDELFAPATNLIGHTEGQFGNVSRRVGEMNPTVYGQEEPGTLSQVAPRYFSEGLPDLPNPEEYIEFKEGGGATPGNIATGDERQRLTRIEDLIGQAVSLQESEPYRAAAIMADAEKFLQDEQAALSQRGEALDERTQAWRQRTQQIWDSWQKANKSSPWGDILMTAGIGALTGGLGAGIAAPILL